MPKEDNKILKYNHGKKSMNTCHNNLKKLSTTKINKRTASGYSLFTNCSFDTTKNKLDYNRGKNCMKIFCLDLKEHATKIINYEEKEMILLKNEEQKYIVSKKYIIYVNKDLVQMI